MNVRQAEARKSKIEKRASELRAQLWPEVTDQSLWNRKQRKGFTTLPRTMPLILRIMDDLSNGKPISSVYVSLWGRVFDNCVVTINSPREMAFEAGFSGQRSESTWSSRIKILCELGFIDTRPGASGPFTYILIWNPYHVIKKYYKEKKVPQNQYNALFQRALDIGASDLEDEI